MKLTELLKNLAEITHYQQRKLKMFIIVALKLNAEHQDNRPKSCPYCKKEPRMIKKGINIENSAIEVNFVKICSLIILELLQLSFLFIDRKI